MPLQIEKMYIDDLKLAFKKYCEKNLVPNNQLKLEWDRFWNELKNKVSVVEKG